jgi:ABC-type uncharacterized transport system involved in gliding motility auxiliary subunit
VKKLGWIYFLMSVISLVSLLVLRMLLGGWVDYLWVPLFFFVVTLAGTIWSFKGLYKEFFRLKTTKEGFSMGAMILIVLAFLISVNYLGLKHYRTFDFSLSKVNTLSEQSLKLLGNLQSDLKVLFFYKNGTEGIDDGRRAFMELIKKYQDQSALVKLQFVEVNENPGLAADYGVDKGSGTVFLDYQGRKSKIEKIDEQEISQALVKVTRENDKKIYYVIGHRERDFEDSKETMGLNQFKKMLEGYRYQMLPLNLNQVQAVPTDADLLMIMGPEQDYLKSEFVAIDKYLEKGGAVWLALKGNKDPGFAAFLATKGVRINTHLVAQVSDTTLGRAVNPQATPANSFPSDEEITKPFGIGEFVVMRLPNSIEKISSPEGVTFTELVSTDKSFMAFADKKFEGKPVAGPFTTAALIKGKEFKIVLFSDVDFVSNQLLYKNLNRDLALNSVSYLANEKDLISIAPKEIDVTQLQLSETQFYAFVFGFIIPLPLLLLIFSGVLWYRRRFA